MSVPVPGGAPSAHLDRFVLERLPAADQMPVFDYSAPHLTGFPDRMNAYDELLGRLIRKGFGPKPAIWFDGRCWSFDQLNDRVERLARLLVEGWGLVPGNRVLIRSINAPMVIASWLAVLKVGGVTVLTMPLLRAHELSFMIERVRVRFALCEASLEAELATAASKTGLERYGLFSPMGDGKTDLDRAIDATPAGGGTAATAADDVAMINFTSGTTGNPKAAMQFHRDIVATSECWPQLLGVGPHDVHCGAPSLAFSYGQGGLLMFPLRHGAQTVLLAKSTPDAILEAIQRHRVTNLFAVPTAYNSMLELGGRYDLSSLRKCCSAGEHLRMKTFEAWRALSGLPLINGIGSTEMHGHFVCERNDVEKPGSTGRPVPGFTAKLIDEAGNTITKAGERGWLAVRGPTGCRYMDDPERQAKYVRQGWNVTGDIFERDPEGVYWYVDRGDDMIVTSGYNVSGQEVERAVMEHPLVRECAVIGVPDEARGTIVKAFVVLKDSRDANDANAKAIQDFVKAAIAPYKYPRAIRFVEDLPKTMTGKIQRFRLKEIE
ncbi:MAG: AMP-binding protein [Rhodospirillales bacterium]|nr:AMP-binding protein [Rhodospirillales bacterium]